MPYIAAGHWTIAPLDDDRVAEVTRYLANAFRQPWYVTKADPSFVRSTNQRGVFDRWR
jgi:hypothetical protein